MKRMFLVLFLAAATLATGCARKDVLVTPGPLDVPAFQGQSAGKWAFFVKSVSDDRADLDKADPMLIGYLGQRFDENKTTVHMDKTPEVYFKEQLSRFLLNKEMEAASVEKAKAVMEISLKKFGFESDTTKFLDMLAFAIDYEIKFYAPDCRYLGAIRLPEKRMIKDFTPLGAEKHSLEVLILDTLSSTFTFLAQSEIYKNASEGK